MDKRPLVVWCDDNSDVRALAAIEARNHGWDIFTTSHAIGALAEYKRSCPDAIVLDLILPTFSTDVESGLDACAEIRKIDSKIPIIIFTGMDTAIAKPAGFASGASWTFIKTEASLEDIFDKIEEIRGNRREKEKAMGAPGAKEVANELFKKLVCFVCALGLIGYIFWRETNEAHWRGQREAAESQILRTLDDEKGWSADLQAYIFNLTNHLSEKGFKVDPLPERKKHSEPAQPQDPGKE